MKTAPAQLCISKVIYNYITIHHLSVFQVIRDKVKSFAQLAASSTRSE